MSGLAALRAFARERPAEERCELCGAPLAPTHEHLTEGASGRLRCACQACGILFEASPAARWRRVRRRAERLPGFRLSDAAWARLGVPVDVAFVVRSRAAGGVVALCPGPAGLAQIAVDPGAWSILAAENPVLAEIEPDVEGLLVSRVGGAREHYRASIDECYRLAGLIRSAWRGLSSGAEAQQATLRFFEELRGTPAAGSPPRRSGAEEGTR